MSQDVAPVPGRLTVTTEWQDRAVRLALAGELDLASVGQVEEQLAAAEARTPQRVVVDLGKLAFIDSTGLRALIQADARARDSDYDLVLWPGDESIQRVFELTGAVDVLRFEQPPGEAQPAGSTS
jgi:anti-anti-sigma factor